MKVFGIPVKVDISFFVIVAILGWNAGGGNLTSVLDWVGVVFVSVLLHELGHAFAAKAFGRTPRIQLYGMMGLTSWSEEGPRLSPLKMILISLAGPFAGFLLGGVVLAGYLLFSTAADRQASQVFQFMLFVNFGWGILNLLPLLPLDGGNVMKSIEELITRKKEGTISRVISLVFALGIVALALNRNTWITFLGVWFALINGAALYQLYQQRNDSQLGGVLEQARQAAQGGNGTLAVRLGQEALESAKSEHGKQSALQVLVHGYIQQRDFERAGEELQRLQSVFGADPYLEGMLLLEKGELDRAISVLEPAFNRAPSQWVGYLLGQALIKAKRFDDALMLCSNPALVSHAPRLYVALAGEAFQDGQYEMSAKAGRLAFERVADPMVAYNIACALARAGRADDAMVWMSRAVEAGFRDRTLLDTDPDLSNLRSTPEFISVRDRLRTLTA